MIENFLMECNLVCTQAPWYCYVFDLCIYFLIVSVGIYVIIILFERFQREKIVNPCLNVFCEHNDFHSKYGCKKELKMCDKKQIGRVRK